MEDNLNSFFKTSIFLLCFLFVKATFALDLQGLYSSTCSRDIGVILGVDQSKIYLLNLQGKVVSVNRYDVVGIANYPINHIPISTIEMPESLSKAIKYYQVKTQFKKTLVDLVQGWPIGFSKDKISFLNKDGREIAVQRTNIWSIKALPSATKRAFTNSVKYQYDFLHPASMAKCPKNLQGNLSENAKRIDIVPQEFISDPVTIKRKFDEILKHHKKVSMYVRSQKFYPVPQVYKNYVTLGFWGVLGSRYGASDSRNNNGAPILVEELSTGPFGYQHIFLTGAAPNGLFIHEEPQTQIYYRFKADYFHMSIFLDPNLFLIGGKYNWQDKDINNGEYRATESFILESGLDFGHLSFIWVPSGAVLMGTKAKNNNSGEFEFNRNTMSWMRYGLAYHNHLFKADVVYGRKRKTFDAEDQLDFNETKGEFEVVTIPSTRYSLHFIRLNGELEIWDKYKISSSLIGRRLSTSGLTSTSYTAATYLDYKISYKYLTRAMLAYERVVSNQRQTENYIKVGLNFSIIF